MHSARVLFIVAAIMHTIDAQTTASPGSSGAGAGVANYIQEVCMPFNASNLPDMAAPCNQIAAIEYQCLLGPGPGLKYFYQTYSPIANESSSASGTHASSSGSYSSSEYNEPQEQSYTVQRDCLCSSQFFEALIGCADCEAAHGATGEEARISKDKKWVWGLNSAYCALNSTPTGDLTTFLSSYGQNHPLNGTGSSSLQTTISDPLSKSTAVTLYYNPSVTGTAAWVVAEASSLSTTAWGATSTGGEFPGLKTSNGMIVPTAVANAKVPNGASSNRNLMVAIALGFLISVAVLV